MLIQLSHRICAELSVARTVISWGKGVLTYIWYTGMCHSNGSLFWQEIHKHGYGFVLKKPKHRSYFARKQSKKMCPIFLKHTKIHLFTVFRVHQ